MNYKMICVSDNFTAHSQCPVAYLSVLLPTAVYATIIGRSSSFRSVSALQAGFLQLILASGTFLHRGLVNINE